MAALLRERDGAWPSRRAPRGVAALVREGLRHRVAPFDQGRRRPAQRRRLRLQPGSRPPQPARRGPKARLSGLQRVHARPGGLEPPILPVRPRPGIPHLERRTHRQPVSRPGRRDAGRGPCRPLRAPLSRRAVLAVPANLAPVAASARAPPSPQEDRQAVRGDGPPRGAQPCDLAPGGRGSQRPRPPEAALYKPAAIDIATTDNEDRRSVWRLIPGVARDGFLLVPTLTTAADAALFLRGQAQSWVRSFHFEARGDQQEFWSHVDVGVFELTGVAMRLTLPHQH